MCAMCVGPLQPTLRRGSKKNAVTNWILLALQEKILYN